MISTGFDISADLTELGRTPVAVVSSGVKSILDIPKTLEYLETQGACVVTFGENNNFPAFFTKDSGYCSPYNVSTFMEVAEMIDVQQRIGLGSGMLIAVPIPDKFAAASEGMEAAIHEAVELAKKNNIVGKDVTPYILNKVNELTKGESLASNVALIENNAMVASRIASCLAKIQADFHSEKTPLSRKVQTPSTTRLTTQTRDICSPEMVNNYNRVDSDRTTNIRSGRPVVVGATVVDFSVQVNDPGLQLNGATYKGTVSKTFGGVGRNIADCLSRLGCNPVFVSAIGADNLSHDVLHYCKHIDMQVVQKLDTIPTAIYCPVLQANGQLLFGVGNMDINSNFSLDKDLDLIFENSPLVVLDGNFNAEVLEAIVLKCVDLSVPVWFEPTDLFKSTKPFTTDAWKHLTFVSPNLGELVSMYSALMKKFEQSYVDFELTENSTLEYIISASVQMCRSLVVYIPVVLVTLGEYGVLLCHGFGDISNLLQIPVIRNTYKDSHFRATYYKALDLAEGSKIVSVSGAGDCFASAFIAGMLKGSSLDSCVQHGMLAALNSLQSPCAVPDTITAKTVLAYEALRVDSDWQPLDVSSGSLYSP